MQGPPPGFYVPYSPTSASPASSGSQLEAPASFYGSGSLGGGPRVYGGSGGTAADAPGSGSSGQPRPYYAGGGAPHGSYPGGGLAGRIFVGKLTVRQKARLLPPLALLAREVQSSV